MRHLLNTLPLLVTLGCEPQAPHVEHHDPMHAHIEQRPVPPTLFAHGTCPGAASLELVGATPHARIAFVSGQTGTMHVMSSGPCSGYTLDMSSPTLRGRQRADAAGALTLSPTLAAAVCTHQVQAIDLATCHVSNVVSLTHAGMSTPLIGNTSSEWTADAFFRGNAYINEHGGTLQGFEVFMGLTRHCDLDFYVFRRNIPGIGSWTLEAASTVHAPPGERFVHSGFLGDISIQPGTEVGLGVGWTCSATYYGQSQANPGALDTSVGRFQYSLWDNHYAGSSTSYTPPQTGPDSIAYFHRYAVR